MKIVITGITTILGRMVAEKLAAAGHDIVGIDTREWPDAPRNVDLVKTDIRKKTAEEVFRVGEPDVVIHMATVAHYSIRFEERYRINLEGTRSIFDYCQRYGVKQILFVGRHTVYGADPDSPLYRTEMDPPLGGMTFPELSDLVTADLFACSALWRFPDITTTVLRIVYTLGPSKRGTLASYLKGMVVPTVLGYDPLYHFMHEQDAAKAIITALDAKLHGVYNIAGNQPVPLSALISRAGRIPAPLPAPLFSKALGRFGLPNLFSGSINHIKFSVVVDNALFKEATGFQHDFTELQILKGFRYSR